MVKQLIATITLIIGLSGLATSAHADDWRLNAIKKIPEAVAATDAAKVEVCTRQSDADIKAACEAAWLKVENDQKAYEPALQAWIAIDNIRGRERLKKMLQTNASTEFKASVARVSAQMAFLRDIYQEDQAKVAETK